MDKKSAARLGGIQKGINAKRRGEMTFENTTNPEFGCACLDSDARRCFELRYPKRTMDEYESTEVCGCTCHDKGIDFDGDDCDCQDCNDRRVV